MFLDCSALCVFWKPECLGSLRCDLEAGNVKKERWELWNELPHFTGHILTLCSLTYAQDCHVLTFSSSGSVSDHLVLHPQLATGNFIIKAVWLPGSQTELAIVTADFVKVNDAGLLVRD